MEYWLIAISSFFASLLTFFSGFGLGTILMPIIALFFPLPIAITVTAMIHFFHNLLKTVLWWMHIEKRIALQFGIPALLAAIPGAWLLHQFSTLPPLMEYSLGWISGEISLLKILIGSLLLCVAVLECFPFVPIPNVFWGGIFSGFLGGLSGYQGAFRSAFLVQSGLGKESFIATSAVIASAVDFIRLLIYSWAFRDVFVHLNLSLLSLTLSGSFLGLLLGSFLLKKVTIGFIQKIILILLCFFGVLLILGII